MYNDENQNFRYSELLDDLDAAVFSGEILYTNINEFEYYIGRWKRAIDEHRKLQGEIVYDSP